MTDGSQLGSYTGGIGNVGDIVVQVRGDAILTGMNSQGLRSGMFNVVTSGAVGNAGDIRLSAGSLSITNGALLQTSTYGQGNAGNVKIQVQDRFLLAGEAAGIYDGTSIFSAVGLDAVGKGGDIDIQAGSLTVLNLAELTANTFALGNAGNITIQVRGQAIFDDGGAFSAVGNSPLLGSGNGGNIRISANQVELRNGTALVTRVSDNSRGNAGSVTITATERVIIDGRNSDGDRSGIFTQVNPGAVGDANNIQITTDRLTLSNGGLLEANIEGVGRAGDIGINARILEVLTGGKLVTTTSGSSSAGNIVIESDRINLSGRDSGLFANAETGATGRGGDINVNARRLSIADQASITVSSLTGQAGNLNIAVDEILLNRGRLTAESGRGSGAEINLSQIESLLLRNNSLISAQAFDNATGGNVTVNAKNGVVVAVPNQTMTLSRSHLKAEGATSRSQPKVFLGLSNGLQLLEIKPMILMQVLSLINQAQSPSIVPISIRLKA
ncbi:MAG: hypothetical protein HC936_01125 [Leptolyngbyaceae cyanobacterium SU_3_3]|nr:hypothetical protein [Leptolyngbyaceae cyanobacterium SU_3_3]